MSKPTRTVLIIDDSAEDRATFRWRLARDENFAYIFHEAEFGAQGVAACRRVQPDCVLIDYNLPDMNGLTVLAVLNPDALDPDFPVILLTGAGDESLAVKAIKNGAQDYLVKSKITSEELRLTICNAIELVELRRKHKQAKDILRASHDTFRHLVENSPFGIYVVDADFRLAQVSAGAQKVFENVRPLIGRDFAEVLRIVWPEPFAREAIGRFRHTLETGEPYHAPSTVEQRQDIDEVESYDWKLERITLPDGRFGVVCHFYDLSERQRYEAELRESEERYRALVRAAAQVEWIAAADGTFHTPQTSWEDFTGQTFDEYRGTGWTETLHPDDLERTLRAWHKAVADKAVYEMENRMRRRDGEYRWMFVRAVPILDEQGEVREWIGTNTDITERKQTQNALQLSEERLSLAMTGANIGAFDWNIKTGEIQWSSEIEEFMAMSPGEFENSFEGFLKLVHPQDHELIRQRIEAAFTDGDYECEFRMLKGDGGIRWVIGKGRVFYDEDGEPTRLIGVDIDTTKRKLAEEALRESQRFTQSIVETAPSVIYIFNIKTNSTTYLTKQVERALGYSLNELENVQADLLGRYMHADDQKLAKKHFNEIMQSYNGEVFEFEYRMRHKSGAWHWFCSRDMVFTRDENGKAEEILGIALDITERREAEEQLRASEQFNRTVLENSPDGVKILDEEGRLQYINANGLCLLEIDDFSLYQNELWWNLWAEEAQPAVKESVVKALHGETTQFQAYSPTMKGTPRWWDVIVSPIHDNEGKPTRLISVSRDITKNKEAEEKLRESEERFRILADAMPQLVWTADSNGTVDYYNSQADKYEVVYRNDIQMWEWPQLLHPEDLAPTVAAWEAAQDGDRYEIEHRIRLRTGEYRWHLSRALAVRDAGHHLVKWFGTATDIHDLKQAEEDRERLLNNEQRLRAEAEEANRLKDEFLATASHELRTPLTAIVGWSRMLRTSNMSEAMAARALETIERNADVQAKLIEDLLDISRIIAGKLVLDMQPIQMTSVISDAVNTVRPAAQAKNITIEINTDAQAGPVLGDKNRLQQVIWNLLSNAVKFTPKDGRVKVTLRRVDSQVEISVSDTGEGIEPEFLPYVFDRFRQADGRTTRRHGGLGLGLAIVRHLVELHGGTVGAYSDGKGYGAIFNLRLLLLGAHHQVTDANRASAGSSTPGQKEGTVVERLAIECPPKLDGLRVLVVDDDPDTREMLDAILSECEAEVVKVASAAEALLEIERQRPNVLVSDIGMPEEDGYELIKKIRTREREQDSRPIPALALTAYAKAEDRIRALSAGYQMHLSKPVEPAELTLVIANLVGRNSASC